jgi:hypothetical protein
MARSKRGGKSHVSGYLHYKTGNREVLNRKARLTKLAAESPNNLQLVTALANVVHRRNKPKAPFWSHSMIRTATVMKQFTGKFDKGIFATDPEVVSAARRARNENKFKHFKAPTLARNGFSIGERTGWTF